MIFFTELKNGAPSLYKKEFAAYEKLHHSNLVNGVLKKDLKYFIKSTFPNAIEPLKKIHHRYHQQVSPFFTKDFYAEFNRTDFKFKQKYASLNDALYYSTMQHGLHSLLRYADRNSMAHGREVRLPFLFHELVSFCFSLPSTMKMQNGWTKWIMRESYKDFLPEEIVWRKDKIGYEPPQDNWLQQQEMQELVWDSTRTLVDQRILDSKVLDYKTTITGQKDQRRWQRLMAANLF
jgi:asparagine synthase (glutamine-hydrolysing)